MNQANDSATTQKESMDTQEPNEGQPGSALERMGLNANLVSMGLDPELRMRKTKRICICGHSTNHHFTEGPLQICSFGQGNCMCGKNIPVLEASDLRWFMRSTEGPGPDHALSRGIYMAEQNGATVKFFKTPSCFKCNDGRIGYPVALDRNFFVVNRPGTHNMFLCRECILSRGGSVDWLDFETN
jgi:hypothetical protein